jgi:hypothetical protein
LAIIVPPSASTADGWSAAMSACATAPQVVPRLRTCTSPVHDAAVVSAVGSDDAAVWLWVTSAPIEVWLPLSVI